MTVTYQWIGVQLPHLKAVSRIVEQGRVAGIVAAATVATHGVCITGNDSRGLRIVRNRIGSYLGPAQKVVAS
jgi:hypothetical protein